MKKLTVLVSLYNAGDFLASKLECLSRQTIIRECEVVLLLCPAYDGDNFELEKGIYRDFVNTNNARVIEYSEYVKLYKSWNDGISVTNSQYVTNSNVDDLLNDRYYEIMCCELDSRANGSDAIDVVHCDVHVTDRPNCLWPAWKYHGIINTDYPGSTLGPCPVWRRSLHTKFGLFEDFYVVSDALLWEKWRLGGVRFGKVITSEPMALYLQGNNLELRVDHNTGISFRDLMEIAERLTSSASA